MELLAPAGNWESFIAAMENGADAVYMGGREFSARQYAANFEIEEIKKAVEYAHVRGRKVYITVNTLIDESEFDAVLDFVFQLQESGIDALIVQDIGLLSVLPEVFPDLALHASTQMTIHNQAGAELLKANGVKRVVLARELSREETAAIHKAVPDIELEIFVHGALCYSYSGQCLLSSVVGGRSGNRGRCAQPCRLPYRLCSSRREYANVRGNYPLSPADLCLIQHLPEIKAAGVTALKIEGRMKRSEYVAVVTRVYRQALTLLKAGEWRVFPEMMEDLAGIFNRTFTTGLWSGERAGILNPSRPNNRGVYIGRVSEQRPGGLTGIHLKKNLRTGDGIEFWVKSGRNPAAVVQSIEVNGKQVQEAEAGSVAFVAIEGRTSPGDRVFRTHDSLLIKEARGSITENGPGGKVGIRARVEVREGQPLKITLATREGLKAEACTVSPAVVAEKKPLEPDDVYEKINRLGNTPFYLEDFQLDMGEGLMVPFSEINEARRRAASVLEAKILEQSKPPAISREEFVKACKKEEKKKEEDLPFGQVSMPKLAVFAATLELAESALVAGADLAYVPIAGLEKRDEKWWEDIRVLQESAAKRGQQLVLALPRIAGPLEKIPWENIEEVGPNGVLVSNPGAFIEASRRGFKVFGDYPLNTFNPEAARFWPEKGAEHVCLSPELSLKQLRNWPQDLLARSEILVHGDLVLMVSAYCPWIGLGLAKPGRCGQVCRSDDFCLVDRRDYRFPIRSDVNCRVHLFNSRTLCLLEELPVLMAMGFASLRVEAWLGTAEATREVVRSYRKAVDRLREGLLVELEPLKEDIKRFAHSEFSKIHFYRGVI